MFYERRDQQGVFVFQKNFNFAKYLVQKLVEYIRLIKQETVLPIFIPFYLRVLCKFLQNSPSLLRAFCKEEESTLKVFLILFEYLQVLGYDLNCLDLVCEIVKTLKVLVRSNMGKETLTFFRIFFQKRFLQQV